MYEYKTTHILGILITLACATLIPIYLSKKDEKTTWRFLRILGIAVLSTYILRRVIDFSLGSNHSGKDFLRTFWLFYLCNINTVLLSLMLIFKVKKGYEYVAITGFIGGVVTFLIPDGIFYDRYLTFSIFDSMFSHFILVVVPPILIVKNIWKPNINRLNQVILGMLLVVINVEIVQRIFFGKDYVDYLFFHSAIPFSIPNRPDLQYLVISSLFIAVLALIYFINYLATSYRYKKNTSNSNNLQAA